MKESFFIALSFCVLFSCATDDSKDVLSYNEIGASPSKNPDFKTNEKAPKDSFEINFNVEVFEQIAGYKIDSVQVLVENEVIDRTNHINTTKVNICIDSNAIQFKSWAFQDSANLKLAWYNMLDCFGDHCESIELFDSLFQIDSYHLVFVADESIDWISSAQNLDSKVWSQYLKKEKIKTKYRYIFETRIDEPIRWYRLDEQDMTLKIDEHD